MTKQFVNFPRNLKSAEPQGPDLLAAERSRATFDVTELTEFVYGKPWLTKFNAVLEILQNDPAFDKSEHYFVSRTDMSRISLRKEKRLVQLAKMHKWGLEEIQMAEFITDMPGQFGVHRSMFIPTLLSQGTDDQREKWLKPAMNYEIIGCYAQTELGHGSNVQGLETTATYIPETKEFEINSPTLTAIKWWAGGLGTAANHAVVMARLITNGKDYGPHPFVVQVRDIETHKPMPRITVGDIGPKFGINTTDNGFARFDHVRIPHFNMLAKYAQVNPATGEYVSPPYTKLSYGTMVLVRVYIVVGARHALARAATIAIRYSAVRQQFVDKENPKRLPNGRITETAVIDYTMQQYRLFPVIAQAYACYFTGKAMMELYTVYTKQSLKGDFSLLADLHATSSGLKALTSSMTVDAIEDCRRACGGHGYSSFSGLVHFYQNYLPNSTFEGDNYLLTQQVCRHLFKTYRMLIAGGMASKADITTNPTIEYLRAYIQNPKAKCDATTPKAFDNPALQLAAYGHRAAHLIANAVEQLDKRGVTWNASLIDIYRVSRAHCQYVLVRNFIEGVNGNSMNAHQNLRPVLTTVCNLFALHTMERELSDFLVSGYLLPNQAELLHERVLALLSETRPNAVPLVDAFGVPDFVLNSALGRYDGRVYETMCEWATREPLNGITVDVDPDSKVLFREDETSVKSRL